MPDVTPSPSDEETARAEAEFGSVDAYVAALVARDRARRAKIARWKRLVDEADAGGATPDSIKDTRQKGLRVARDRGFLWGERRCSTGSSDSSCRRHRAVRRVRAVRYHDRLHHVFELLAQNPGMARERTEIDKNLRAYPTGQHVILHRKVGDGVLVLPVRHAREDWRGD